MPAASVLHTSVQYLIAFYNRPEAASDVISGRFVRLAIPDKCVKFHNPRLNRSLEIWPIAVRGDIFDRFFPKCRLEVVGDVISGMAVDFSDSARLNIGQIIQLFGRQASFTHFGAIFKCIMQATGNS